METPMQQSPPKSWYQIQAKDDDETDVMVYDEISSFGITAKAFVADLKKIKSKRINMHVNSPGGDVFDGMTIYNAVKNHKAEVVTHIDGVAASIASIIAIAGDEVRMAKNAYMMMHNPYAVAIGDSETMQKMADMLDKLRNTLAQTYAEKTGKPVSKMLDMMSEETWLTADEAVEAGLADAVAEDVGAVKAQWGFPKFYNHIPRPLKRMARSELSGHQALPRGDDDKAATNEVSPMNAETFKAYAAEHPEAVSSFIEQGKNIGNTEAQARMKAIADVCPGRAQLAIDSFVAGRDAEEVQITAKALDAEAAKSKAELEAKDQELTKAKAEIAAAAEKLAFVSSGQQPVATGKTVAMPAGMTSKAQAEWEWDNNPSVRVGFSNRDNYIYGRAAELDKQFRSFEPARKTA